MVVDGKLHLVTCPVSSNLFLRLLHFNSGRLRNFVSSDGMFI